MLNCNFEGGFNYKNKTHPISDDILRYDGSADKWFSVGKMTTAKNGVSVALLNDISTYSEKCKRN